MVFRLGIAWLGIAWAVWLVGVDGAAGPGQVPAMGWNSWNAFRCEINETLVRSVADALVSSGLADAGFRYVNVDDCWMAGRGEDGSIVADATRFPSGMKSLAEYVHSKGLKFGLYSDAGTKTCEGLPGSWGHEREDANMYAYWGVDYLKYDFCNMNDAAGNPLDTPQAAYTRMAKALQATGRPILLSLCSWGVGEPWKWAAPVAHSWRTSRDVFAAWDEDDVQREVLPSYLQSVMSAVRSQAHLARFAQPGAFNDPDMLVVGLAGMTPYGIVQRCPPHIPDCTIGEYVSRERWGMVGGLTAAEQRTHFALWCMMASPLILGNDPRSMDDATVAILTAHDVIAVNQDPLGRQGVRVYSDGAVEVWRKELVGCRLAFLLFNSGSTPADVSVVWARDVPASADACLGAGQRQLSACDEWAQNGECEKNAKYMTETCEESCQRHRDGLPPKPINATCGEQGPVEGAEAWSADARDLWKHASLGALAHNFTASQLAPHASALISVTVTASAASSSWHCDAAAAAPPAQPTLTSSDAASQARSADNTADDATLRAAILAQQAGTPPAEKIGSELPTSSNAVANSTAAATTTTVDSSAHAPDPTATGLAALDGDASPVLRTDSPAVPDSSALSSDAAAATPPPLGNSPSVSERIHALEAEMEKEGDAGELLGDNDDGLQVTAVPTPSEPAANGTQAAGSSSDGVVPEEQAGEGAAEDADRMAALRMQEQEAVRQTGDTTAGDAGDATQDGLRSPPIADSDLAARGGMATEDVPDALNAADPNTEGRGNAAVVRASVNSADPLAEHDFNGASGASGEGAGDAQHDAAGSEASTYEGEDGDSLDEADEPVHDINGNVVFGNVHHDDLGLDEADDDDLDDGGADDGADAVDASMLDGSVDADANDGSEGVTDDRTAKISGGVVEPLSDLEDEDAAAGSTDIHDNLADSFEDGTEGAATHDPYHLVHPEGATLQRPAKGDDGKLKRSRLTDVDMDPRSLPAGGGGAAKGPAAKGLVYIYGPLYAALFLGIVLLLFGGWAVRVYRHSGRPGRTPRRPGTTRYHAV